MKQFKFNFSIFKKLNKKFRTYIILAVVIMVVMSVVLYTWILKDLPSPSDLYSYDLPQTTKIYDRKGELLFKIFTDQDRTVVPIDEIPLYLQQATISIEDKDFYHHPGINPVGGILRAASSSITKGRLEGGSTITQQLMKNTLLTPERTITRKLKEIALSLWAEVLYSKEEILEMYLNTVPYGGTAWGVESAAKRYYNKKVTDLTLGEAALLAGLPVAPTRVSPFGNNPELALDRQKLVLNRMVEEGYITKEEADKAKSEKIVFAQNRTNISAPHFVMFVREKLAEKYGEQVVEKGGISVTTTLDLSIQEMAEEIVASEVADIAKYDVGNGAALVTRPATGEILAMVGSSDYSASDSGWFNVTTALRQPGSSIKPIMYATGIETRKLTAASPIHDEPTCFTVINQEVYCPQNYDGQFHGITHTRFALANSYNIPAVKSLYHIGLEAMIATASAMGIDTFKDPSRYGLSLTLGGGEVTMVDMAEAFGVFSNGGIKKDLIYVLKIKDNKGEVIYEQDKGSLNVVSQLEIVGKRVLSRETAFIVSHILYDNGARSSAFGSSSELVVRGHPEVSVKTGTTNDLRDNWTIGYNQDYLVAAWVGNNDNTPMDRNVVSGVTGAAPIWNEIMTNLLVESKQSWPAIPSGVIGRSICILSSNLPSSEGETCPTRFEYFIKGTEPTDVENLRRIVNIDKTTGRLATGDTAPENIEQQEKSIVYDITGKPYCIDCPPPESPTILTEKAPE
ncbi:MAG: transglycosylase domain-containing protein [bacterium]|nr:transglycosylase domain-containing protein [bacterium]